MAAAAAPIPPPEQAGVSHRLVPPGILWPFVLLTSCFAWWGLANNMTDTLLAAFKRSISLSDFQTSWIQVAFYGSYFCFALPAAIFIKKYSYKAGVLLGLGLFSAGSFLFYPASRTMEYGHFLVALYILAGGLSILETAANPYIIAMGPEATGTRRLNFAQSFNPIGSILGVVLSKVFILSHLHAASAQERAAMPPDQLNTIVSLEMAAIRGPYIAVAVFLAVLWVLIAATAMPKASEVPGPLNLRPTFRRLLRTRHYVWGVVAQFFYVGAQIGVWSFTIRYVMQELKVNEERASSYYIAALVLFTASRFLCTALMRYMTPGNLLTLMAALGIVFSLAVIYAGGVAGVYALVAISGCMSLMFPTIFGLSVRGLVPGDAKLGGSGLIMAILGGAVLTAVQGQVSDAAGSINLSYWVPLACFAVILYFGAVECRKDVPVSSQDGEVART